VSITESVFEPEFATYALGVHATCAAIGIVGVVGAGGAAASFWLGSPLPAAGIPASTVAADPAATIVAGGVTTAMDAPLPAAVAPVLPAGAGATGSAASGSEASPDVLSRGVKSPRSQPAPINTVLRTSDQTASDRFIARDRPTTTRQAGLQRAAKYGCRVDKASATQLRAARSQ
jgi:hypothetical protein